MKNDKRKAYQDWSWEAGQSTEDRIIAAISLDTPQHRRQWIDGFYSWRYTLGKKGKEWKMFADSKHITLESVGRLDLIVHFTLTGKEPRTMKPVQIKRYPEQMVQIALKCGTVLELELESEQAAKALRFDFYGLRRAIEREQAEAQFPDFMRATLVVRGSSLFIGPPEHRGPHTAAAFAKALAQVPEPHPVPMPTHTPAPAFDPYAAYTAPNNPLVQAQDTAAFEDAIEAWLGAPAPEPEQADKTSCPTTEQSGEKTP